MWIEQYTNWAHSIGFHMYTIPLIIVALIALILGIVHWVKQNKRNKNAEEERENRRNGNGQEALASGPEV